MLNALARRHLSNVLALMLAVLQSGHARAGESSGRHLGVGEVEVASLPGPIGTIIVGDPEIVATTLIDDRTIALTGKAHGRTEVVILDDTGSELADWRVAVGSIHAVIYRGSEPQRMACATICLPDAAEAPETPPTAE